MQESLKAVLFDLDGTLVRTFIDFPVMKQAMQSFAAGYGADQFTSGTEDVLEIVERTVQFVGAEQGAQVRREAYAILEAMEEEGCANPQEIEGASELLTNLQARGVSIGIITRNARSISTRLLARQKLPFDVLTAREDTTEFKPHPAPVLLVCRRFDVVPSRCAIVGDLWTDIAAGKAAGVQTTVGIQWPHDPPQRFTRCPPDIEVHSLAEAAPLLLAKT